MIGVRCCRVVVCGNDVPSDRAQNLDSIKNESADSHDKWYKSLTGATVALLSKNSILRAKIHARSRIPVCSRPRAQKRGTLMRTRVKFFFLPLRRLRFFCSTLGKLPNQTLLIRDLKIVSLTRLTSLLMRNKYFCGYLLFAIFLLFVVRFQR